MGRGWPKLGARPAGHPSLVPDTGGHRGVRGALLDQGWLQQPRRLWRLPALALAPHGRQARRLLRRDHRWRRLHRRRHRQAHLASQIVSTERVAPSRPPAAYL